MGRRATRVDISLACEKCGNRNYRTTRSLTKPDPVELKKYCRYCDAHTIHRETK